MGNIFNHSYWDELANVSISESFSICKSSTFTDTEEYIDEMYDIDERYDVIIDCKVKREWLYIDAYC